MTSFGFIGKILELNLSNGQISTRKTHSYLPEYPGGLGLNTKILYDEVGPDVEPYSEDNLVIISPGALTGTNAPASSRGEVTTKSPLTGIMGTGNFGGLWGPRLKYAGYDSLIIKGLASRQVYLTINNDKVVLKDASKLWSMDCYNITDKLREKHGENVSVMAIGPAGENLVRFAAPVFDKQHMPGRCHAGAVLGYKKLKAVVVQGTNPIQISDREGFKKAVERSENRIKSFPGWKSRAKAGSMGCTAPSSTGEDYEDISQPFLRRGEPGCYCPCMMEAFYGCSLRTDIKQGEHAGTDVVCAGLTLYSNAAEQLEIDLPAAFRMNDECQRMGMDMFGSLYYAMDLYSRGIITVEDTAGLQLTKGRPNDLLKIIKMTALRQGFGDILAEGAVRVSEVIGRGSDKYLPTVKKLESMRLDPRATLGNSLCTILSILTNPRGGDDLKGTHGLSNYPGVSCWARKLGWTEEKYRDWLLGWLDMPKAVKLEIFGDPPNITDIDHPTVTKWYGDLSSIYNSLGFCLFASTVVDALGPTYMFDLYSTATGFKTTPEQLMETGERVFNLMRLYAIREGISVEDDDWKPDYYTEPSYAGIDEGPPFNKEIILKALRKYYDLRGWDKKTGKPTSETSKRLGLPSTI